jgi:integrase
LAEVLEKLYLPEKQTIQSPGTQRLYIVAIDAFGRYLGHIATLNDLTDAKVGGYMRWLRKNGKAIRTVNGNRSKLIALWGWCARKRLVEDFPTIEQIPVPHELPSAWTAAELRALLKACDMMPGKIGEIPAPLWFRALVLVEWDTGERTGAMLALRWDWLDHERRQIAVPAEFRKGRRKPMLYSLKRETIRALDAIREPQRELIFERPFGLERFFARWKRLLKLAGLPYVKHKSGLQKMRRSFATHIEAAGGDATEALAHTARSLTVNSYIDPRLVERTPANNVLFSLTGETK